MIIRGDALTELKKLSNESINCVMTSPPYWALRDYGVDGQLGLEPTFDLYIKHLCDIFDEVKRVLRDDGTIWVNLGDTYFGGGTGQDKSMKNGKYVKANFKAIANALNSRDKKYNYPAKSLCMIPQRFAIEMVNRGWILRNTIIWHKPNCMPSSVKDRFTVDFEYIFFFSKKKKYYFETQYEPYSKATMEDSRFNPGTKDHHSYNWKAEGVDDDLNIKVQRGGFKQGSDKGRNKRTVWKIKPKPFKEAHFAVYPEELCETPIKSGCPEFVCKKCGNPKVIHKKIIGTKKVPPIGGIKHLKNGNPVYSGNTNQLVKENVGLKPTCSCNAGFTSGIVLDPFFGAGTTGLVALKQGKNFLGIELNPEYIKIAKKRLKPYLEQTKLELIGENYEPL